MQYYFNTNKDDSDDDDDDDHTALKGLKVTCVISTGRPELVILIPANRGAEISYSSES